MNTFDSDSQRKKDRKPKQTTMRAGRYGMSFQQMITDDKILRKHNDT